jgi:hypothetical protein
MREQAVDEEARRQQALLAAIVAREPHPPALPLREDAARAAQGLAAYRGNAAAIAERALGAVFPTVATMIGAEDFEHLARDFWSVSPPRRGDLGEWGGDFPDWLQAHADFTTWPYLGDTARLDLALHHCECAADAELDAASLALLESSDPARLRLLLMPGTALIASRWPLATIHAAHRGASAGFDAVRAALACGDAETVLVARQGWRAVVHHVDAPTARWTGQLLAGNDLGRAFAEAGEGFDFSAWLVTALREKWLKGASAEGDEVVQETFAEPS